MAGSIETVINYDVHKKGLDSDICGMQLQSLGEQTMSVCKFSVQCYTQESFLSLLFTFNKELGQNV